MVSKMLVQPISTLLEFVQMLQPRQHDLFTRLFNLTRQEDFIKDSVNLCPPKSAIHLSLFIALSCSFFVAAYLVEVEHQIQFTHVPEELIQHFDEEMYGFQVC
jgi:hypothetical protein